MKQSFFTLLCTLILFSLSSGVAFAAYPTDTNCQPIYGGGETCEPGVNISIDKKVINPATNKEVDNLSINDPKFKPGQNIIFNIYITNTGTTPIYDSELADVLPKYITFSSVNTTNSLEKGVVYASVTSLKPGETKAFQVKGKIKAAKDLPSDKGIICDINTVTVSNEDISDGDKAGFCIQQDVTVTITPTTVPGNPTSSTVTAPTTAPALGKVVVIPGKTKGGQPVYEAPKTVETPETGPELLGLLGFIPTALGGHFLRKKSK